MHCCPSVSTLSTLPLQILFGYNEMVTSYDCSFLFLRAFLLLRIFFFAAFPSHFCAVTAVTPHYFVENPPPFKSISIFFVNWTSAHASHSPIISVISPLSASFHTTHKMYYYRLEKYKIGLHFQVFIFSSLLSVLETFHFGRQGCFTLFSSVILWKKNLRTV